MSRWRIRLSSRKLFVQDVRSPSWTRSPEARLFVEKFMNYHAAPLLAEGNIPALAQRKKVIHSIVRPSAINRGSSRIRYSRRLSRVRRGRVTCFPEELLEQRRATQFNFYYFYGFLDHQSVLLAAGLAG